MTGHAQVRSYVKPGVPRPVVIPAYKDVPVFIIRDGSRQQVCRGMITSACWSR